MPEPRTCQLPTSPAFVCIRFEHLGQAETQQLDRTSIVITNITEQGGRR